MDKKAFAAISAGAIAVGMVSMASATPAEFKSYTKPVKLCDYLYELSYTDYTTSAESVLQVPAMACSSVRNGNFHGRNLDFFYNEMIEYVVHVSAKEGRHASLAVCGAFATSATDPVGGMDDEWYMALPGKAFDGINDCGVSININVVPGEDTAPVTGTNPGKPRLHVAGVVRHVLDNAASASEAVRLIENLDVFGSIGHYSVHYMINDTNETYIVEFIDNKVKWTRQNIMVNFYHTLPQPTRFSSGLERFDILKANYSEGATFDGMCKLMQRVKYSQAYDRKTVPFWYSEHVNAPGPDGKMLTISSPRQDFAQAITNAVEEFAKRDRKTGFEKNIWHTVHTSVYDLALRKLRLFVQEEYSRAFDFTL